MRLRSKDPFLRKRKFSGFKSRCAILFWWQYPIASIIWVKIYRASFSENEPFYIIALNSSPPSHRLYDSNQVTLWPDKETFHHHRLREVLLLMDDLLLWEYEALWLELSSRGFWAYKVFSQQKIYPRSDLFFWLCIRFQMILVQAPRSGNCLPDCKIRSLFRYFLVLLLSKKLSQSSWPFSYSKLFINLNAVINLLL